MFFRPFLFFFFYEFLYEWMTEWMTKWMNGMHFFLAAKVWDPFLYTIYLIHPCFIKVSIFYFQYMFRFFSILACLHWGEPLFLNKCLVTPEYQPHTRPTSQPVRFAKTCHDFDHLELQNATPVFLKSYV